MTFQANRRVVFAELALVEAELSRGSIEALAAELAAARAALGEPSTIDVLVDQFELSAFERAIVVACLAIELRAEMVQACVAASGAPYPTFRAMLATHPEAHFSALSPQRPLRAYRLISVRGDDSLLSARLQIDERILHWVLGVEAIDIGLRGIVDAIPCSPLGHVPAAYATLIDRIQTVWIAPDRRQIVQLCGDDMASKLLIVKELCSGQDVELYRARGADLPASTSERDRVARLWEREAALCRRMLLVEVTDHDTSDVRATATAFVEQVGALVIVAARDPLAVDRVRSSRIDVTPLSALDQHAVWQQELAVPSEVVETELSAVIGQFRLGLSQLQAAACEIRDELVLDASAPLGRLAWRACRRQARPKLDELALRIEPIATWESLVLPEAKLRVLRDLAAHVRHTRTVYETWGFASRGDRGLGITALFAGASGTGKTMAAEVIARELDLDLYKIDLSQLVSKYIGETEKNLRRVFDAAEQCGSLLLFDEADSLFGKRSEVKDSHDRYANLEVSYLLQRMEQYRGLAILTTNMRRSLDTAFLRRLRFVVEFPFPDASHRIEIWRRAFPSATPLGAVDHAKLARLNISGGIIHTIALNAAFLAADSGEPVGMHHLDRAAREEFGKLEKPYEGAV